MAEKKCFVICPIGSPGSETRKRSDNLLEYILRPILSEFDYEVVRADQIGRPGIITNQVIERVIRDDLVIADLTGHNANVFYELAVRHVVKKPYIQIYYPEERIPFDLSTVRTIPLDITNIASIEQCKEELRRQIEAIEQDPTNIESPISLALDFEQLAASDNVIEKALPEIMDRLQEIQGELVSQNRRKVARELGAAMVATSSMGSSSEKRIRERILYLFEDKRSVTLSEIINKIELKPPLVMEAIESLMRTGDIFCVMEGDETVYRRIAI